MPSGGGSTRRTRSRYIIDRNINYTNVCVADCKFCAFYRRPKDDEGYVLSFEQIGAKIDECKALGGVQILMQGGHNPYIPFEWYLDLMRYIKRNHPIHIHGFSPSEVVFFSERFGLTRGRRRPRAPCGGARQHSRRRRGDPGGRVRERVAKKKAQTEEWLGVQEEAHRQGMKTSVTMMYGLGETDADRIEHLFRVRELQARTGGFTAFICWPLQPEGTPGMSHTRRPTRSPICARWRSAGSCSPTCRTSSRPGSRWATRWARWRCASAPTTSAA